MSDPTSVTYKFCAEELRTKAELVSLEGRLGYLHIAECYDRLAEQRERMELSEARIQQVCEATGISRCRR